MTSSHEIGKLPVGYKFKPVDYTVSKKDVDNYLSAVGTSSEFYSRNEICPPKALLAFSLRSIMEEISLPEGSIHVSQEMNCYGTICNNDKVILGGEISQNSSRSGWRYLTLDVTVESGTKKCSISGKATILVPE